MKERFRYTSIVCDECGGTIVQDISKGEKYCIKCGLLTETRIYAEIISLPKYNDYNLRQCIYENFKDKKH